MYVQAPVKVYVDCIKYISHNSVSMTGRQFPPSLGPCAMAYADVGVNKAGGTRSSFIVSG